MQFKFLRSHYQDLIHEYKVDVESLIPFGLLKEIKQTYLDNYKEVKLKHNQANISLGSFDHLREYSLNVDDKLKKLIEKFYVVENNFGRGNCSVYYSNKNMGVYDFHDHYKPGGGGSIGAVFYWTNIKEGDGGEISFKRPHLPEYKIFPKNHTLYTFPYWLAHKPNPVEGEGERFCFNWNYISNNRVVHKIIGSVW
jgi:hypothetical protein